jgi:hypothetical protein
LLSGRKSQPLPRKCWTCRKALKSLPIADYSGVASVCATTRESQVSYQSIFATDGKSRGQSHYESEMPIAAFSSRDASQYSYFSATLKSCCISSGVGGAGGLFGSNGRASSRKKL